MARKFRRYLAELVRHWQKRTSVVQASRLTSALAASGGGVVFGSDAGFSAPCQLNSAT
jgi:hypothetical protein